MNLIDAAGMLALGTRLQRLSERLRKEGAQVYKACGIDFEPKWFPVIYTLTLKPVLGVVEIAEEIGYTHPSTISLLKELEKMKLIRSKKDKVDERKRLIQLTAKGRQLVEQMRPVWDGITAALTAITDTPHNLMAAIREVEEKLETQSFEEVAKEKMGLTVPRT
ncbi:MarR family transcriptional regulator [Chitinophaga lutea]|uniref:MarR family transcriptional regulator n=1 Tax=Chitinophaga lutea TaxID=2488634 RepID=A0A3N4PSS5_9BACT|nr:MarR family winged helix-turn-helix transcriptional regulator [Chitinophaga lutea]RPE08061.1 MarR family transcriptional regulator [Chitinophaga lutea]